MSRIQDAFARAQRESRGALVVYLTAGDPSLETTGELVLDFAERGVDVIELGLPFSDSLADGPTIQAACHRAIAAGTTPPQVLDLVADIRRQCDVPLVVMTAFNLVQRAGLAAFADRAVEVGIDGVLASDLPPSEAHEWVSLARDHGLDTIFLVAPTTPAKRARLIVELCSGFVYCVSVTGVTGARDQLPPGLGEMLARIRETTDLPLAVGFGLSTREQIAGVCEVADGAIVGSAVVKRIAEHTGEDGLVATVGEFVRELVQGAREGRAK
jgi:tryptophan synthase alpha chain